MRRTAVMLSKGGTAKTTTAVNLAHALALAGERVLLVDTDPQRHAGFILGVDGPGLAAVLDGTPAAECIVNARDGLDVLPGGADLVEAKARLASRSLGREHVLREALEDVEGYGWCITDCAPGWDTLSVNVLLAVEDLIVPVSPEALSAVGLTDFLGRVEQAKKYNPSLRLECVLPTFYDRRVAKTAEIVQQLKTHFGDGIVSEAIRYSVRLSEASGVRQTIFEYARRSAGAVDYAKLARRLRDGT